MPVSNQPLKLPLVLIVLWTYNRCAQASTLNNYAVKTLTEEFHEIMLELHKALKNIDYYS